jgi:hypothetical protein
MAEVVDSIIAEFIGRDNGYVQTFNDATAAHARFKTSVDALKGQTFDLSAEGQKYKAGVSGMASAEEQASARIKTARKGTTDAAIADDQRRQQSAKATADAEVAEAQRSARLRAAVEKGIANSRIKTGSGTNIGATVPREASMIPNSVVPAASTDTLVAEAEVNHLLADQAVLQAQLTAARGADRDIIRDQLTELRLINNLKRAGLTDEEATIKAEATLAAIEAERAATAGKLSTANAKNAAERFAEGAGLQRTGGSPYAVAGLAAAATIGVGIAAVGTSINYAKQLEDTSKQLGLTTTQLQVYQRAANDVGVSNTKLQSGFGQLAAYLGRAQEGDKQAAKTFETLGINLKGVGSAGEILPTLIARLSSIEDPAKRAAVETRLFGEAGRDLDPLLSGGIDKVNDLATSMERAGSVLSPADIADLTKAGQVLGDVKQQLEVDVAHVVAGNASAIESLATAFGHLITNMGGAARILQDEGLQALIFGHNHADVVAASNPSTYLTQVRLPALQQAKKEYQDALSGGDARSPAEIAQQLKFGQNPPSAVDAAAAKLRTEIGLTRTATQQVLAAKTPVQPSAQAGKVGDLSKLFAPAGKSAATLEAEALARLKAFQDQLAASQEEQLRAQESLTSDVNEQAKIEDELADRTLAKRLADIQDQQKRNVANGADPKIEAARAAELTAAAKAATAEDKKVIEQNKQVALLQAQTAHLQTQLSIEADTLNDKLALAQTAKERRELELELLANAQKQKENDLNAIIANPKSTPDQVTDATSQLKALPGQTALQAKGIAQRDASPINAYLQTLPDTADKLNEALESVAVDGLQHLTDGITDAITGAKSLGAAFHDVALQIISDLVKIAIEKEVVEPLAGALFGGATGGAGGILGSIFHFANGGSFTAGGNPGIDSNTLSINGVPRAMISADETVAIVPRNMGAKPKNVQPGSGGTTIVQNISIDASNSVNPDGFEQRILQQSAQQAAIAAQIGGAQGRQGALTRITRPTLPRSQG